MSDNTATAEVVKPPANVIDSKVVAHRSTAFVQREESHQPIDLVELAGRELEVLPEMADMRIFKDEQQINAKKRKSQEPIFVDFGSLAWNNNVRTASTLALPQMIRSMLSRGYDPAYPISVSIQEDGSYLVLRGNRRTLALGAIRDEDQAAFDRILVNGQLPAIVYEKLTEAEEILLRNDHSAFHGQVGLDEWGEFLQLRQLMRAGYSSQAGLAAKLGKFKTGEDGSLNPNRSWIQQRCNLARLPQFVIDEYEMLMRRKEPQFVDTHPGAAETPVRWGKVASLYKAHFADREKGIIDSIEGGPELQATWAEVMRKKEPVAPPPAALDAAALQKLSKDVVTDDILVETLLKASGKETAHSWQDLNAQLLKLRKDSATLTEIRVHQGSGKFKSLVAGAHKRALSDTKTSS